MDNLITECDACVIVHNICDKNSFEYSQNIATKIRFRSSDFIKNDRQTPILMVGNKSDLQHLRFV